VADQHRKRKRGIQERRVAVSPPKAELLLAGCRRVGVEHFQEAVRDEIEDVAIPVATPPQAR
jgi:hypothetical protein